jgi:hypothetical protein
LGSGARKDMRVRDVRDPDHKSSHSNGRSRREVGFRPSAMRATAVEGSPLTVARLVPLFRQTRDATAPMARNHGLQPGD